MLADIALGSTSLLGRFPGPDRLFLTICEKITFRLDHPRRSERTLVLRGAIALLFIAAVFLPLGAWLEGLIITSKAGAVAGLVLLLMIMGQRAALDAASELVTILCDVDNRQDHSRFDAARWGVERLVLRLSDGMIINATILFITGLGGLLCYRMLTMLLSVGAPNGILKPASPFYKVPLIIYEAITIIPAALATLLILTAGLLVPGVQFHMLAILEEEVPDAILGRKFPVLAIAHGMQFSFRQDSNIHGGKTQWVGPKDGRRKLEATDLRSAVYLVIATWVLALIMIGLMAFPVFYKL